MWNDFVARARALSERIREAPQTVRVAARLSRETGLLCELTGPGLIALGRVFAGGSQNPSQLYRVHAKNSPNKPAIIWHGEATTWGELDQRIDRLAAGLKRRGIGRRQSLIVMLHNRPE